jgi:hypothetical protein
MNAPERIWLDRASVACEAFAASRESMIHTDIEYVRADLFAALEEKIATATEWCDKGAPHAHIADRLRAP